MRKIITILYFFILTTSYGQEIELNGKYGASFIGGETIEFVGKDSFYFGGFYCTYGVRGKGRCEIKNNFLYLYFEKSTLKNKEETTKSPIITKTKIVDSVAILNITCLDINMTPVSYATVQLKRKNKAPIGTITDSSGHAAFTIKKSDIPIELETSSIAFKPGRVNIDTYSSYNIQIFHKTDLVDKELNNGEILVYEIEELSEDLILMRPENSREKPRRYRKKN